MKLENQVTSLELCKRLRELDVKQGYTMFYWDDSKEDSRLLYYKEISEMHEKFQAAMTDYFSAFTVAELLELLPVGISTNNPEPFNNYRFSLWKCLFVEDPRDPKITYNYIMNYECDTHIVTDQPWDKRYLTKNIWDKNPANTMAKMLIYLYEKGLMKND